MATSLWVRVIRRSRTERETVEPCERDAPEEALSEACRRLDLSRPLWLDKNRREWREFSQTRFLPDAFMEPVHFDRLEIELIDPEARKGRSMDPRNA